MYTIGSCGFCSTGSSAVTDILKEYNSNTVLDDLEFTLAWCVDGLEDLRYHMFEGCCRDVSSRVAIERFNQRFISKAFESFQILTNGQFEKLIKQYIDDITQVKWIGSLHPMLSNKIRRHVNNYAHKIKAFETLSKYEKKKGQYISVYPLAEIRMSIRPECYIERSKELVQDVLNALGAVPGTNTVLDQPFPGNNPQMFFKYFNNPKAIVVDRDPRDHYLFARNFLYKKGHRQIPAYNVKDYVTFYRNERENQPYLENRDDILRINFEDTIYNHEDARAKILHFCDVDPSTRNKHIFEPEKSIHNTQLFKRYPEYKTDIEYIMKELSEYLYPFDDFGEINTEGEMFFGRSSLNQKHSLRRI